MTCLPLVAISAPFYSAIIAAIAAAYVAAADPHLDAPSQALTQHQSYPYPVTSSRVNLEPIMKFCS